MVGVEDPKTMYKFREGYLTLLKKFYLLSIPKLFYLVFKKNMVGKKVGRSFFWKAFFGSLPAFKRYQNMTGF